MASKTISELDAKSPLSTDLIPVADPTTGIAGKSTVFNLLSSGNSFSNVPFAPTPNSDSVIYAGLSNNHVKGSFSTVIPSFLGGYTVGTNTSFNYSYTGNYFSESNITSIVLNEKELWGGQSASVFQFFPKVQSITAPNLIQGNLQFNDKYSLQSLNFPVFSSGTLSLINSIYNFTGAFNPVPAFKNGSMIIQNFGTQASSVTFPELENADSLLFTFGSSHYRAPNLTSFSAPKLKMARTLNISNCQVLTSLSFPELLCVNQSLQFNPQFIQTASFPKLEIAPTIFEVACPSLTTFTAPLLRTIINSFNNNINQCPLLTAINLPELVYGGLPQMTLNGSSTGTSFSFAQLTTFIQATSSSALLTINLPKIRFMTGVSASINITGATSLSSVTLNQTPSWYVGNIIITNAALNQASVDGILAACAYQDGVNNAPYPAYSSKTINLSGGTSATPSAAGLASKAILVARGCTVTHN